MRKRPLCYVCLIFLIVKSLILAVDGGRRFENVPAGSVFSDGKEKEVWVKGQVYQKKNTSNIQVLYLKNNSVYSQNNSFEESKIIVYDKTFRKIEIGKTVKIKGTTGLFEESRNPGNFNQSLYYRRQKIYGFVRSKKIMEISGEEDFLRNQLYRIRESWESCLLSVMGEKNGSILSGILLGEKGEMDEAVKELYQKNGIGHILAISGLHISFIGLGVYHLFRKLGCPYWTAGICASCLLGMYACMVGISVSVLRACVMVLLRIGADMTGRVYDMATALALAGAVTVLWRPLSLTDAGFFMSYGAILGILLILPQLERLFPCRFRLLKGFYASTAISVMLFPLLLYFYFEFPVYSLFLNMAVIPMMAVVLGLGIFGSILCVIFMPLGKWLLWSCGLILEFFETLGKAAGALPGARIVFGQPAVWQIVVYYLLLMTGLLMVYRFLKKKKGSILRLRVCSVSVFCLLILMFGAGHDRLLSCMNRAGFSVTIVDVGQGDGIFMRGPRGGAYLVDGGSSDVKKVGKYRIEPFLKSQGVGSLDYVFISHGDNDHCSGVEEMMERRDMGVKIRNLVLPVTYREDEGLSQLALSAKKNGVSVLVMKKGVALTEGKLSVRCVQPSETEGFTGNEGSMVLDVKFGNFDMLLTGDVEGAGEERLVENLHGKTYDALKVAHHGSKNSTGERFLEEVRPKIAVISAGKQNRYGHPHGETLERLRKIRCEIYNTQESGAVTIKTDGESVWIEENFFITLAV